MDLSKLPKLSQTPPPPPAVDSGPVAGEPGTAGQPTAPTVELFCRCGTPIAPGTNFCAHCGASYHEATGGRGRGRRTEDGAIVGAEAWMSIAIGAILLFVFRRAIEYLINPAAVDAAWTFSDPGGNPLTYRQTGFYWADLAAAAFAATIVLEGIVTLLVRRAGVMLTAFVVTVAVLLLNVFGLVKVAQVHGANNVQIINVFAIAFGGYIAFYQFATCRALAGRR
jgi:hypothetical protein